MDEKSFLDSYTRTEDGKRALIEQPGGDCVFLENGTRCRIYAARPAQCRAWPFWPANLKSKIAWERSAEKCPGMNRGTLFTLEEILRFVRDFKCGDA